jgi:hypothetical protein
MGNGVQRLIGPAPDLRRCLSVPPADALAIDAAVALSFT